VITSVARAGEADPSRAVRALACAAVAARLGASSGDLRIERVARRPPVLLRRGRRVAATLSLSHHGRFVAFACALHRLASENTA
jgi:hypothetical protein